MDTSDLVVKDKDTGGCTRSSDTKTRPIPSREARTSNSSEPESWPSVPWKSVSAGRNRASSSSLGSVGATLRVVGESKRTPTTGGLQGARYPDFHEKLVGR
jgi:hypothetical protein